MGCSSMPAPFSQGSCQEAVVHTDVPGMLLLQVAETVQLPPHDPVAIANTKWVPCLRCDLLQLADCALPSHSRIPYGPSQFQASVPVAAHVMFPHQQCVAF
jgi:hypothetical protein